MSASGTGKGKKATGEQHAFETEREVSEHVAHYDPVHHTEEDLATAMARKASFGKSAGGGGATHVEPAGSGGFTQVRPHPQADCRAPAGWVPRLSLIVLQR